MTITENPPVQTGTPHISVLVDRCVGCQECIVRCPTEALTLNVAAMVAVGQDKLCIGCRQCERTCPFSAIVIDGPVLVAARAEQPVYRPYPLIGDVTETRSGIATWAEAISEADRCVTCPDPTCVRGCPTHNDIPAFISAIAHSDLVGAHAVLRRTSVLPDICARVCDQAIQCEGACTWSLAGEQPVAIGALERFVCDNLPVPPVGLPAQGAAAAPTVAIIGSGPAGLAAAWELVEAGAHVTVYDRDDEAGGLLRWGIPDFTLPAEIAERPVTALAEAGVTFELGSDVQPEDLDRLAADNDAVIIAVGAGRPMRLQIPGADLPGVWDASRFLVEARAALNRGTALDALRKPDHQAKVLVLGAGNTAMDVARTARRLGADVVCVDWMDRRFAPVRPDELAEAEGEGVIIRFTTTLEALSGQDGAVHSARLARTQQRKAGTLPKIIARSSEAMEVDLVVMAMGYRLDPDMAARSGGVPVRKTVPPFIDRRWVASGLFANVAPEHARRQPVGMLALGRETARRAAAVARTPRTWVVGDALTGPATVVEAMAQGKEAARGVIAAARAGELHS